MKTESYLHFTQNSPRAGEGHDTDWTDFVEAVRYKCRGLPMEEAIADRIIGELSAEKDFKEASLGERLGMVEDRLDKLAGNPELMRQVVTEAVLAHEASLNDDTDQRSDSYEPEAA